MPDDHKYQRVDNGFDSTSGPLYSLSKCCDAAFTYRHRQVFWRLCGLVLYTTVIVFLVSLQASRYGGGACPDSLATSEACAVFVEQALLQRSAAAASLAANAASVQQEERVASSHEQSPAADEKEIDDVTGSGSKVANSNGVDTAVDFETYMHEDGVDVEGEVSSSPLPGRNDVDRVQQRCRWDAKRFDTRPFPSADSFRLFSDFIFDDIDMCNEPPVNASFFPGCSIFVKGELLPRFFEEVHPLVRVPYVLVTHNTDHDAPRDTRAQFGVPNLWENKTDLTAEVTSNTLTAWFGVNMVAKNLPAYQLATEKFFNIPIGIQNVRYFDPVQYSMRLDNATRTDRSECLAFVAWRSWTSAVRHLNHFEHMQNETHPDFDSGFVVWTEKRKPAEWMEQVMRCKYVVAPRGNGVDTHRHWESMILGAIPITEKGPLDPLYEEFPMLVVDSYDDITRELLHEKYDNLKTRLDDKRQQAKLYTSYWFNKIRRKQFDARAAYFDVAQKWEPKIFGTPPMATETPVALDGEPS